MRTSPHSPSLRQRPEEPVALAAPRPSLSSPVAWLLIAVVILSAAFLSIGRAEVTAVGPIGLVVQDLDRELDFYTGVLPFEKRSESESEGPELDRLYGLDGVHLRTAVLQLGTETITLTEFQSPKGRAIPADSRSFDHWFQHIAIVVRDMDAAYAQLQKARIRHVSTSPQTLPLSNPNAGGIRAFYFQDPEGHVLEIIWFPPTKGDPRWQQPSTKLFLGIDHTAIVVSDTEKSLAFYRDKLGLRVAGGAENFGVEQEHLNQVFGARLRITALRAERGPGIEFLEYITPPGGRPLSEDARLNDALAWTISLEEAAQKETPIRSKPRTVVRDPDRHALIIGSIPAAAE
jgi:catechol 2,3-dioxygenase-like lactoylglutathione lyase family enzyme